MFAAALDVTCGEVVEREGFVYGDLLLRPAEQTPREGPAES
jgi:hypothetical protein